MFLSKTSHLCDIRTSEGETLESVKCAKKLLVEVDIRPSFIENILLGLMQESWETY